MSKENELCKALVEFGIKRVLAGKAGKETQHEHNLQNYFGRGMAPQGSTMVADGVVKRTQGDRGAVILAFVEQPEPGAGGRIA